VQLARRKICPKDVNNNGKKRNLNERQVAVEQKRQKKIPIRTVALLKGVWVEIHHERAGDSKIHAGGVLPEKSKSVLKQQKAQTDCEGKPTGTVSEAEH